MAIPNETYGTMYYVEDMKEAVAFYKKLGFQPKMEHEEWTEFQFGGHALCLHASDGDDVIDGGVLIFKTDGVKALHQKFKGDKIKVTEPKEVYENTWSFMVEDPTGNKVNFYGKP